MKKKYKVLLKDTVIFAIGSFGSKLILFFLVPLYTNYLTTAEYGTADLVSTFASLIVPISSLAINRAIIRFSMKETIYHQDVIKTTFVALFLSSFVVLSICSLLRYYEPIKEWRYYLYFIVIFENFFEAEKNYLKVKDKNKVLSIICILDTFVLAISNIIMLSMLRLGIKGYLTANILARVFGCVICIFAEDLISDLKNGKFDRFLAYKMLSFSFPLIFSDISWWVIHSTDKIMIERMVSDSALGLYTVATKIPSMMNVLISIFNQAWAISSIKEAETTGETTFYSSVFDLYCFFTFGACILFIAIIKPFMNIYVGADFKDAWVYIPFLMVSAVFFAFTVFISSLYAAMNKSKHDMWTSIMCAMTNVVVNYFAIRAYGIWGAVIGTVTAYFVCAIMRIIDIRSIIKLEVQPTFWINMLLILLHGIVVSIQWKPTIVSILIICTFVVLNKREALLIVTDIKSFLLRR